MGKGLVRHRVSTYCAAMGFLLCGGAAVAGEDPKLFTPSIAVSEEYNDNIFESPHNKKEDFVTRVLPGFVMAYRTPFWDWDIGYTFDYRHYDKGSRDDEITHNANVKGILRMIDNFLYLDISDHYSRISLDVLRDTTTESLFVNQIDQNILSLSPYVVLRPATNTTVKTGARYVKTSYFDSAGIDYDEYGAFASVSRELSPKCVLTINANYSYDDASSNVNYSRLTPAVGVRYEYADKSFIAIEGGYTWLFYAGGTNASPYWNVALTHTFAFVTASASTGIVYNTDPLLGASEQQTVAGRLDKTLERGTVSLYASYSDMKNSLNDTLISRKFELGTAMKYEVGHKTTVHLDLVADKFGGTSANTTFLGVNYPYRFLVGTGASLALKDNLILSLDYNYVTYRNSIDSGSNSTDINRVILGVSKTF